MHYFDIDHNHVKGALCSFGEEMQTHNYNIHNINKVINIIKSDINLYFL